jgi:hypothetical protein
MFSGGTDRYPILTKTKSLSQISQTLADAFRQRQTGSQSRALTFATDDLV